MNPDTLDAVYRRCSRALRSLTTKEARLEVMRRLQAMLDYEKDAK